MSCNRTFVRGDTWTFDFQIGNRSALAAQQGVATAVSTNTLTDAAQAWTPSAWAGYLLHVEGGPGAGGLYQILDNTATVLTIERGWDGRPAASRSLYNILAPEDVSAWTVSATVKANQDDTDAEALIGPVWATLGSDADTALGKGSVTLTSAVTGAATPGKLWYDIQATDAGTPPVVHTVELGTLTVKADVALADVLS